MGFNNVYTFELAVKSGGELSCLNLNKYNCLKPPGYYRNILEFKLTVLSLQGLSPIGLYIIKIIRR